MKKQPRLLLDEQIEQAKNISLYDYLSSKGYIIENKGSSYKLKISNPYPGDLSSLSIFPNKKSWKRWSNGHNGGDTISFLKSEMNMSFQEAVEELTYRNSNKLSSIKSNITTVIEHEKQLKLPEKCDSKYSRVFAYLNKTRKIDACIINKLIHDKKIYQDKKGNVVFVGFNEKNEPSFASVRGTTEKVYRGDCEGSDKRYSFNIKGSNTAKLFVFEAPIDALSHATLTNKFIGNDNAWKVHSRLALSGVTDMALEHYLENNPEIKTLYFCLDNDEPGKNTSEELIKKYSEKGYECISSPPPSDYKDYNEYLRTFEKKNKESTFLAKVNEKQFTLVNKEIKIFEYKKINNNEIIIKISTEDKNILADILNLNQNKILKR
jgi:hypothetical protein